MDHNALIIDATTEIFSTMIMLEAVPQPPQTSRDPVFNCSVSGMIGMAGLYKGMLAIHASTEVALAITGSFLGLEVVEINEDVSDAFGELANMLAGSIKHQLSSQGADIKLSIPSTICGQDYRIDCSSSCRSQVVPFGIPDGVFLVELQIERQDGPPPCLRRELNDESGSAYRPRHHRGVRDDDSACRSTPAGALGDDQPV